VRCKPESIGHARAGDRNADASQRERRNSSADGEIGELLMRGPQFGAGILEVPDATAAAIRRRRLVLVGEIVTRDAKWLYYVLDRSKEMIKYKGLLHRARGN
jgi:acyl-CoA synthetase (AMP-forming)/AMP-acid ligase II